MSVAWPGVLVLLGLVPLLIAVYVWALRRRRAAVRYSSLALVRAALPQRAAWRRHVPAALFLLAASSLVLAMARPMATVHVPVSQAVIVLAVDVSRSMCATDIAPNRMVAAQAAALAFVQRQPAGTLIGLVAFAGFAELIQPPTTDQAALRTAIQSLTTARRTAIGSGILAAIDAIAEVDPSVAPSVQRGASGPLPTPVPEGTFVPNIIVVLTDGVSNAGPEPLAAAQQAADRGIRVYTIGFGTDQSYGALPYCGLQNQMDGGFGGGSPFGGGLGGFRRGIDEAALQQVADLTHGEYYAATSAHELHTVFQNLPTTFVIIEETTEVSVAFAAAGALLALLALLLSWRMNPLG